MRFVPLEEEEQVTPSLTFVPLEAAEPEPEKESFLDYTGRMVGTVFDAITGNEKRGSVLENPDLLEEQKPLIERRGAPVTEEYAAGAKLAMEKLTPAQREVAAAAPGFKGSVARAAKEQIEQTQAAGDTMRLTFGAVEDRAERIARDAGVQLAPGVARSLAERELETGMGPQFASEVVDEAASDMLVRKARDLGISAQMIPQTALKGMADIAQLVSAGTVGKELSDKLDAELSRMRSEKSTEAQIKAVQLQNLLDSGTADAGAVLQFIISNPDMVAEMGLESLGYALPAGAGGAVAGRIAKSLDYIKKMPAPQRAALMESIQTGGAIASNTALSAGLTFASTDADTAGKYQAAGIAAIGSLLSGLATRGGAEGAIARGLKPGAGSALASVARTTARETGQEFVEGTSQAVGQQVGETGTVDPRAAIKQGVMEAAIGAGVGGAVGAAEALNAPPSPQQIAARALADELSGRNFTPEMTAAAADQIFATRSVEGSGVNAVGAMRVEQMRAAAASTEEQAGMATAKILEAPTIDAAIAAAEQATNLGAEAANINAAAGQTEAALSSTSPIVDRLVPVPKSSDLMAGVETALAQQEAADIAAQQTTAAATTPAAPSVSATVAPKTPAMAEAETELLTPTLVEAVRTTVPAAAEPTTADIDAGMQALESSLDVVRSKVDGIRQRMQARGMDTTGLPVLNTPPADLARPVLEISGLLGEQFGSAVVPYFDPDPKAANGFEIGGVPYVNVALPSTNVGATSLHEWHHTVQRLAEADIRMGLTDSPALRYVGSVDALFGDMSKEGKRNYIVNFLRVDELNALRAKQRREGTPRMEAIRQFDEKIAEYMNDPEVQKEMVADFVGNRATDREFINGLAAADPRGFKAFAEKWLKIIDNLIQSLRGTGKNIESANVDRYLKDLSKAKLVLRDAMIKYSREQKAGAGTQSDAGIRFSEQQEEPLDFGSFNIDAFDLTAPKETEEEKRARLNEEMRREQAKRDAEELQRQRDAEALRRASASRDRAARDPQTPPTTEDLKEAGLMAENAIDVMVNAEGARLSVVVPAYAARPNEGVRIGGVDDGSRRYGDNSAFTNGVTFTDEEVTAYAKRMAARFWLHENYDLTRAYRKSTALKVAQAWRKISQKAGVYKTKRVEQISPDKLFKDVAEEIGALKDANISTYESGYGGIEVDLTEKSTGRSFRASISKRQSESVCCTMGLAGSKFGTEFYVVAAEWSRAKGLKFRSDDYISHINTYRRTEQAMSFALRYGDSTVLMPGQQNRVYGYDKNASTQEAHDMNIARLAYANLRNVMELFPDVRRYTYDPKTDRFMDSRGNEAEAKIEEAVKNPTARKFGLGRSSIARAVMTAQIIRGDIEIDAIDSFAKPIMYSLAQQDYDGGVGEGWGDLDAEGKPTFSEGMQNFLKDNKLVTEDGAPIVWFHGTARDITQFRPKQANAIYLTNRPEFAEDFALMSSDYMVQNAVSEIGEDGVAKARKQAIAKVKADKTMPMSMRKEIAKQIEEPMPRGEALDYLNEALRDLMPTGPNIMPLIARAENPFDYESDSQVSALIALLAADSSGKTISVTPVGSGGLDKAMEPEVLEGVIKSGAWDYIEAPEVQRVLRDELGHDGFYIKENGTRNLAVYQPNQVKSFIGNNGDFDLQNADIRFSRAQAEQPEIRFSDTQQELANWASNVYAGRRADPGFVIAEQPPIELQMFGVGRSRPVVLGSDFVRHLRNRGREKLVPAELIGRVPELMRKPRAVIESIENGQKRYGVIVDATDAKGDPLLLALRPDILTMGRQSVRVVDARTLFGTEASLAHVLRAINRGDRVWLSEKDVARVKDFTGGGLIPQGQRVAAPPRTTGVDPQRQAAKVSQATTAMVYGPRALVKYRAGGSDWSLLKEDVRVTPDDIRRAGTIMFSRSQEDTNAFQRWSDGLDVVSEGEYEGGPAVFRAFHGTTHSGITQFKRVGHTDGFLGKGPYFTTSAEDASLNYAGMGPDLTIRVDTEAEQIGESFSYDDAYAEMVLSDYFMSEDFQRFGEEAPEIDDENLDDLKDKYGEAAVRHAARAAVAGDTMGLMMPVYVKMARPFDASGNGNTRLTTETEYSEDGEEIVSESGTLLEFIQAAQTVNGYYNGALDSFISQISSDTEYTMPEIFEAARRTINDAYGDDGERVSFGGVLSEIAEEAGYDGIIMSAGSEFGPGRFMGMGIRVGGMRGLELDTLHMVPFKAENVKSATGNDGTFGIDNPDIRYSFSQRDELGLFSALARSIESMPTRSATAETWKNSIRSLVNKGEVKAEEVEWTGVNDWLDMQQGRVTRDALLGFVGNGGVKVSEVELGGDKADRKISLLTPSEAKRRRKDGMPVGWTDGNEVFLEVLDDDEALERFEQGAVIGWTDRNSVTKVVNEEEITDEFSPLREEVEIGDGFWVDLGPNFDGGNYQSPYKDYVLPGGQRYREVLLTLPENPVMRDAVTPDVERIISELPSGVVKSLPREAVEPFAKSTADRFGVPFKQVLDGILYVRGEGVSPIVKRSYKSPHWDQPNVLAHIRVNDRVDVDGNRVLFVEELQSDWAQRGRKKGFMGAPNQRLDAINSKISEAEGRLRGVQEEMASKTSPDDLYDLIDKRDELRSEINALAREASILSDDGIGRVPTAPFVTKTEGWLNLALKRVITMAVDQGYDKVAFVNGKQSAERYDLSRQVERINYRKNDGDTYDLTAFDTGMESVLIDEKGVDLSRVEDLVGKEIAAKIEQGQGRKSRGADGWKQLSGVDLKVGGTGMIAFYDKIVPTAMGKLLKKVGGKQLESVTMGEGKDAITQTGFSVTDKMIEKVEDGLPRFSRYQGTRGNRFVVPGETRISKARRAVQDYFLPVLEVQRAITAQGGMIRESSDVYLAEERMYGRVEETLRDFRKRWFDPMIEKAQRNGITMDELSLFAYAKHAKERNAYIQNLRSDMPNNGSGMSNDEADDILIMFDVFNKTPIMEDLHSDLMAITAATRRVMLDEDLISQDEYDAMENQYANYVPLRGFEAVDSSGERVPFRSGGRGFNIRGKETTRALGRRTRAGDIIENIVMDYERAVFRGERNQVAKSFLQLIQDNPDPGLWEIDARRTRTSLDRSTGRVARSTVIDSGPDTVSVKLNGREVYIKVKDERLLRALRKASTDETGALERFINNTSGRMISVIRASLTQYNPIFAVVNAIRDIQTGAVNTLEELGGRGVKLYLKHYRAALASAARHQTDSLGNQGVLFGDPVMDRYFEEYRAAGGTTGGYYGKSAEDVRGEIRNVLLAAGAAPVNLTEKIKLAGGRPTLKFVQSVGKILEFAGATSENAARVAAFRAAREMGKSPAEAASIAKNLTTNFNRKGEWGGVLNGSYLFFNAAIQGTARTVKALRNRKVQGLMAAATAFGATTAILGVMVGGDDEDDGQAYWDKIPDFEKERNFIIMLPPGTKMDGLSEVGKNGRYIKIPMPYGYNVFPLLGVQIVDAVRNMQDSTRGVKPTKAAINMVNAILGSYNPFGGAIDPSSASSIGMAVSPTLIDIGIQMGAGVNSFDRPTAPYKSDFDLDPDSENVNARQAGGIWHQIARGLNAATGGDRFEPGMIDVAPGTLENAVKQITGGTGTFLSDVFLNLPTKLYQVANEMDAEITARDIPLLRNLYGTVDDVSDISLLYDRRRAILEARTREKNREDAGVDPTGTPEQNALASLSSMANAYTKAMAQIRREEIELAEDQEMSTTEKNTRRKELKAERGQLAKEFNAEYMEVMRAVNRGEFD